MSNTSAYELRETLFRAQDNDKASVETKTTEAGFAIIPSSLNSCESSYDSLNSCESSCDWWNDVCCRPTKESSRFVLAAMIMIALVGDILGPRALFAQLRQTSSRQTDDGRVYWPRHDFVIPFNVDLTGQAPREIQLEYSADRGASWSTYSRSDVRTKQFQFQAKDDGEYQFRLKTIDNQGRLFDNPGEPLRVFVDTTKPDGKLIVDIDPQGVMLAEFLLWDEALDPDSVLLTYQTESLAQPREIEFEIANGRERGQWIGKGSWNLPAGTRQLAVRLVAKDKAGNTVEVNRLPQLPRSAAVNNSLQLASGKPRDNKSSQTIGSGVVPPRPEPSPPTEILSLNSPIAPNRPAASEGRFGTGSQGLQFQDESNAIRIEGNGTRFPGPSRHPSYQEPSDTRAISSSNPKTSRLPIRELTEQEYEQVVAPKSNLVAKRTNQSVLERDVETLDSIKTATPNVELAPNIERIEGSSTFRHKIQPLFSSSKAFSLDYSIENELDSPVSSIELWGTTDQGQTWQLWGKDPDHASPFDIQVESEGLFGFRMIIVGANGLASNRPLHGDNADAWIHVDLERPSVKLTSALYGKGKESGSMIIEYSALDDHFPERPITLSYSESPNGPWKIIASGVRNNGRYVWPADPTLPASLYLRIEAHDAAGNMGVHRLDTPIDVQGLAPRGKIQGFRPIQ
jgi:hypothetical protein